MFFLRHRAGLVYLILSLLPIHSFAFSFQLDAPPQPCSNTTMTISGLNPNNQYGALVVPYGPSPLPGGVEVRQVLEYEWTASSTMTSISINYPIGSQFVIAMVDTNGFMTNGTSQVMQIQDGNDASCFSFNETISPPFSFNTFPNQFTQCSPSQIWWDGQDVQGALIFLAIVPGSQSFPVPMTDVTNMTDLTSGFYWTPPTQIGSELVFVGGDARGMAVAPIFSNTVIQNANASCSVGTASNSTSEGSSNSISAINQIPTSSGTASGTHPTNSVDSSGRENDGIKMVIVSGILGAFVGIFSIALLLFVLWRRMGMRRRPNGRSINLVGDCPPTPEAARRISRWGYVQEYYTPRPFLLQSDVMSDAGSGKKRDPNYHSFCGSSSSLLGGSLVHSPTSSVDSPPYDEALVAIPGSARKPNSHRQMRAVNVIQHVDAELAKSLVPPGRQWDTIELPPVYGNNRRTC